MIVNWDVLLRQFRRPILGRVLFLVTSILICGGIGLIGIGFAYIIGVPINIYQLLFAVVGFSAMGAIMGFVVIIRGH